MRHLSVFVCLWGLVHGSIKINCVEKQEAAVGGRVTLQCQLITTHPNIFQITWQKESGNFTGPVATYSKKYGQKLIGYSYHCTEQVTADTLNVSAITISPVTLEDQGCFSCIFNIYPFGANSGRTCLDVYETNISDPILEIHQTESPDTSEKLSIVTCSATGQPAPSITWELPDNLEITPETYTIVNLNRTVTVISNFTQRFARTLEGIEVTCVVHHPALYSEKRLSALIDHTRSEGSSPRPFRVILPVVLAVVVLIGALCVILFHPKVGKRLISVCKTGKKTTNLLPTTANSVLLPNKRELSTPAA
ncbi:OX-2 membrane glycoprotein-like isoform X1 [Mixophyes fleayi]|uniref:OX-2 membrane glycoprotein-like isoform X1 n=1 Tax=Mixophyes fleayi TaxID=3061075 RepID=UPI003F4E0240